MEDVYIVSLKRVMEGKYAPLEQYLRGLPLVEEEVT